jgi:hypothetical protein
MRTKRPFAVAAVLTTLCGIAALAASNRGAGIVRENTGNAQYTGTGMQPLRTTMTPLLTPVEIGASLDALPDSERRALAAIIAAARIMDSLFLEQVWAGNPSLLLQLSNDDTPQGRARLNFFLVNKGPWSRVQDNQPFVPSVPPKPAGANYYPSDASRDEIERWIAQLPDSERTDATGYFTTIRRGADGALRAVPYSLEYQAQLAVAAAHLREAAQLTNNSSLARYLELRANAFSTNDYYESDVAWMELDSTIEPTIGPYEVYEDTWFNYKAAFEAFVTIRDDAETSRIERFGEYLQELEDNLPIDPNLRDPELGALAPIRVVNVVFTAGDANSGVQTAAFNLPNDERVIRDYGSKRVMLKNVQEAKFQSVLAPIAELAVDDTDRAEVSFEAFFTHILMHELMHGLGPHNILVEGAETTVRRQLQDTYSVIEEAKADISGLWALQYLIDRGVVDRSMERSIYTTFLASTFRSIRFGINEAHGKGVAIQLNTFLDTGAVTVRPGGTFAVDHERIAAAVEGLTRRLLTVQAQGDYVAAQSILENYGVIRPEVQRVLDRLETIPIDIEPLYVSADALSAP